MISVCHISTLTRWGGVERLLVDLLTHVKQDRVRHTLITTSSASEIVQPIECDQQRFEYLWPVRLFQECLAYVPKEPSDWTWFLQLIDWIIPDLD